MAIIRVALDVPVNRLFDYLAPGAGTDDIGRCVRVPFGNHNHSDSRKISGVILDIGEISSIPEEKLKYAGQIDRETLPLPRSLLQLFEFCSRYYHYPIGQAVMNGLPASLRQSNHIARRKPAVSPDWKLTEAGKAIPLSAIPSRAKAKHQLFSLLHEHGIMTAEACKTLPPHSRKLLQEFRDRGWVEQYLAQPDKPVFSTAPAPVPTEEQAHAISAILGSTGTFSPWLLNGVTGSGKTEIYLQAATSLLAQQKQVLILVPEINLTPQLEAVFRKRFPGTTLVSLHSGLNDSERWHGWQQAQQGKAGIILGTRLAIFTPIPELGLIIVDEEHDYSFKQQDGLRYSARDLAIYRARQAGIPIILGSATPSLESYHQALTGRYRLLRLHSRAISRATLPAIRCIDLRITSTQEGLSEPVLEALRRNLSKKQQSLVFINRRGYAPVLLCKSCRWIATCKRCSSRLVVHLRERQLRCHYCGDQQPVSPACPQCGDPDILPFGHGTQRVEAALVSHFPEAHILRVDRDSIRHKDAWQKVLERIHRGEADILVGTQLLAKGHDFPNLTLVCVLNADASLYSTDFRAEEHLFAQLMQVAGRAGRANIPGTVLIQTEFPQHALYQALQRQDYTMYAQAQLKERKSAGFPPFVYLAVLRAEAPVLTDALEFLQQLAAVAALSEDYAHIRLYDPVPAPMQRLKGLERAQLLIQARSRRHLQLFLSDWHQRIAALPVRRKIRWHLDVDPLTV
ncbi:primosomal protein N' [Nitrosomonas sp.]|uniref:primosomal protein N' n=1 Tax=Nitrosomonas sp. TaxID=42353 RepID=UPI0025DDC486|nr:primosomal protein N' [Nitrosomonas sp.]MCC6916682.1 primosomal protein N' [Nitrosomonas sp.]